MMLKEHGSIAVRPDTNRVTKPVELNTSARSNAQLPAAVANQRLKRTAHGRLRRPQSAA